MPNKNGKENTSDKAQKIRRRIETSIGRAGYPLPPFENHMIRQRVTRHGDIFPLEPPEELPGCSMPRDLVGVVKVGTVRKWLEHKRRWDARYKQTKARIHKKRLRDMAVGYEVFGEGELPPPSALAGRRRLGTKEFEKAKARSMGLSLWALWGSKHDQMTVKREHQAEKTPEVTAATPGQGQGARAFSDLEKQEQSARQENLPPSTTDRATGRAWRTMVRDEHQTDGGDAAGGKADLRPAGPVGDDGGDTGKLASPETNAKQLLSPDDAMVTGVTGKRVMLGGLASPFSLRKEPETASMITLATPMDQRSIRPSTVDSSSASAVLPANEDSENPGTIESAEHDRSRNGDDASQGTAATPFLTPFSLVERPGMERFITAEEVPRASP
jgi:hypothetical protein